MRRIAFGAIGTLCLAALGCSAGDTSATGAPVASKQQPIIAGTADTGHPAAVAIINFIVDSQGNIQGDTACTGTIFQVNGSTGYVLTAAHCTLGEPSQGIPDPQPQYMRVFQGNDYSCLYQDPNGGACPAGSVHFVTAIGHDCQYQAGTSNPSPDHDFGMITINNCSSSTPTMPLLPTAAGGDMMTAGESVEMVGFGATTSPPSQNNPNSVKMHVTNTLNTQFMSTTTIGVYQSTTGPGGTCEGDSGGPWLVTVGGQQYVGAVTSVGDLNCSQFGIAARISSAYDSFITPYVNGTNNCGSMGTGGSGGGTSSTCSACEQSVTASNGSCGTQVTTCANDANCKNILNLCGCAQTDNTCINNCVSTNQAGLGLYQAILDCICFTGCQTDCATDSLCAPQGMCGFTLSDGTPQGMTCETCVEQNCCQALDACFKDQTCHECADGASKDASCGSNQLLGAVDQCLKGPCASACGNQGTGGSTGSGGTTGSAGATSTGGTTGSAGATSTGGTTGSTGGSTASGGTGTGAGATTGGGGSPFGTAGTTGSTGGSGTGVGTGGAGGSVAPFGTGTGTGNAPATGDQSGDTSTNQANSGSSGGCSVPNGGSSSPLGAIVIGLAAFFASRRKKH